MAAPGSHCVIHIDTGMNRLGLTEREVMGLAEQRDRLAALNIRYVISHLACADTPEHPLNERQRQAFETLSAVWGLPLRLSLANSSGIFMGENYHFDLARPGCALYGINPQPGTSNPMQGVVTLKARILQVRDIDKAGTVGYGATFTALPSSKYAALSVGYADGYFRSFTGAGKVVIHGVKCPVIGRVSMDSIVVDISQIKQPVRTSDWAEIIGAQHPVDAAAAEAGTIGYEILTALGQRYERKYTGG
jgi:alanine racemase